MKRSAMLMVSVAITVLLAAGVALAAQITCKVGEAECKGTQRSDNMQGTAGVDRMIGEGGIDVMHGNGGPDAVKGKGENDRVFGDDGDDFVKGGAGRDRVDGGAGDDVVRGGRHGQTNDGSPDLLLCGPGNDEVYYTKGVDEIRDCEVLNPS